MSVDPTPPLTTTEGLKAGDVLNVAVKLKDKSNGQDFWWRRFVAVLEVSGRRRLVAVTLKMHPDLAKDVREISLGGDDQVVTYLPEEQYPQGVVAMRMKLIMTRVIKLDHE